MHTKAKNKFVQLSAEETAKFKKKVQPVFDRFKKLLDDGGDDGKKILAEVEALEAKYSQLSGAPASTRGEPRWLSKVNGRTRPTDPAGRLLFAIAESGDHRRRAELRDGRPS